MAEPFWSASVGSRHSAPGKGVSERPERMAAGLVASLGDCG